MEIHFGNGSISRWGKLCPADSALRIARMTACKGEERNECSMLLFSVLPTYLCVFFLIILIFFLNVSVHCSNSVHMHTNMPYIWENELTLHLSPFTGAHLSWEKWGFPSGLGVFYRHGAPSQKDRCQQSMYTHFQNPARAGKGQQSNLHTPSFCQEKRQRTLARHVY